MKSCLIQKVPTLWSVEADGSSDIWHRTSQFGSTAVYLGFWCGQPAKSFFAASGQEISGWREAWGFYDVSVACVRFGTEFVVGVRIDLNNVSLPCGFFATYSLGERNEFQNNSIASYVFQYNFQCFNRQETVVLNENVKILPRTRNENGTR